MTKIYLIRHAEAEGNLFRRSQGQYNSNITPLGRRQIAALAERFRSVPIDALWSSDLCRAQSTASAIQKNHPALRLYTTAALREIGMGAWEDVPWGELNRAYPEQMQLFSTDPARWSIPGGESYEAVTARYRSTILELAAAYDGKTVAVVGHGLGIRALLCDCLGVPSAEIARVPYGDNTAVAELAVDGGSIRVLRYNDNSHLSDDLSTFARQSWWRQKSGLIAPETYTTFAPMRFPEDADLFSHCYEQTWLCSHGNLKGYVPAIYQRAALLLAQRDPRCVVKLFSGDDFAGTVELDPDRGQEQGAGWISLIYLEPACRDRRLGIQLLGHAVSFFRRAGRDSIRLHVSQTNTEALGFYEHNGFRPIGQAGGVGGKLYLMELDIRPRVYVLP